MSVIEVKEAANSGFLLVDEEGISNYTRTFFIRTDTVMGPKEVLLQAINTDHQHAGINLPGIHDTYSLNPAGNPTALEEDPNTIVVSLNPQRHPKDKTFWTVQVEYQTRPGWEFGDADAGSITFHLPEVEFYQQFLTKPLQFDKDRKVPTYTTGLRIKGIQVDAHRLGVRITRNETSYDTQKAISYVDAINSDVIFVGVEKFKAKLNVYHGRRAVFQNNIIYFSVTYDILFNKDTWIIKVANEGLESGKIVPTESQGNLRPIFDATGRAITTPVFLDANSNVLAAGADPHIIDIHHYQERAFALLNLPPLSVNLNPLPNPPPNP